MAGVLQRCIEARNRLETLKSDANDDLPRHCYRLVMEYGDAFQDVVAFLHDPQARVSLPSACDSALTELWGIMVDGQMLVYDCLLSLSPARRRSHNTNSTSVEIAFCLNLRKLYACVDILKCVYAEAAGKPDSTTYVSPTGDVTARINRMKTCCKKSLHPKHGAGDHTKIGFDELRCLGLEGYDMGAFGRVHNHSWCNERVAVRMFPGVDEKRLQSEASRLIRLQHPHLVQVIGYGESSNTSTAHMGFLVMECLQQTTLKTFLVQIKGPGSSFPFDVALHILLEVAEVVKHLHDHGVVHGNLSTQTVLVVPVRLEPELDAPQGYVHAKLSMIGNDLSAESKILPESADVCSFAWMCVEVLGGGLASRNLGASQIIDLPDECPTFLTRYLNKCLGPDPKERPNFSGICDMLQLCKDMVTSAYNFPSKLPSVNKRYAEALHHLLGFEGCTSSVMLESEGEPWLPPEVFLEVLVHALATNTELRSAGWQAALLRASRYCGGWTLPALRISDPRVLLNAIETHLEKEGIWRLGLCYELGRLGGLVQRTKAVAMYEKAIAQGFVSARIELGLCRAYGRGVEKQRQRADDEWKQALRHQNQSQTPLVSVRELIESLISNVNTADRDSNNLLSDIKTRIIELNHKSAVGTALVAGPSLCNIALLCTLRGSSPTIDDILGHLAFRSAEIRNYLQPDLQVVPVEVPRRNLAVVDADGFVDWVDDRVEDGLTIFFRFVFRLFLLGFCHTVIFVVPVVLAVFFLTASRFWLAGAMLLLSLGIWYSAESLVRILL